MKPKTKANNNENCDMDWETLLGDNEAKESSPIRTKLVSITDIKSIPQIKPVSKPVPVQKVSNLEKNHYTSQYDDEYDEDDDEYDDWGRA